MGIGTGIHRIMAAVHITTVVIFDVVTQPDAIIAVIAREDDAGVGMVAGIVESPKT